MAGFIAKFGLDASDFSRGLDALVPKARAASAKLEATFENGSERRRRTLRKTARLAKNRAASVNKAWLAMTAAGGIAAGMMIRALSLAAERNDRVKGTIGGMRGAWTEMLADIGEESSLLLEGQMTYGEALVEGRKLWTDFWGVAFSGSVKHVQNINRILDLEKKLTKERKGQKAFAQEMLKLRGQGGDQDAADRLAVQRYTQSIQSLNLSLQKNRELVAKFKENLANSRVTNQGDAQSFRDQSMQISLGVFNARAKTPGQEIDAAQKSAREEERLALRAINDDQKLSLEEQLSLIEQTKWAIAERLKIRVKEITDTEAAQKKADKRSLDSLIQSNKIQMLELGGQKKQAEVMKIQQETAEAIRDIREGGGDPAQQREAIESLRALGIARLKDLKKSGGEERSIGAGFFGSSASRSMVLGAPSGGTPGESIIAAAINTSIGVLERIEQLLDDGGAGFRGPVLT